MSWQKVVAASQVKIGQSLSIAVGEDRLLLCKMSDDTIFAVDDCCSHDGGQLGQGTLDGHIVECPRHGARFDVRDGRAVRMPAVAPIETYAVRLSVDGWYEVDLEDAP